MDKQFDWIKVVRELREIGKMDLLEAKLCMDYIRDNFIPKALEKNDKQTTKHILMEHLAYLIDSKVNGIEFNYKSIADLAIDLEEKQTLSDCECKECIDKNHSVDVNETIEKQEVCPDPIYVFNHTGCLKKYTQTIPRQKIELLKIDYMSGNFQSQVAIELQAIKDKVNELVKNSWEE